jgi:hypothetical protein
MHYPTRSRYHQELMRRNFRWHLRALDVLLWLHILVYVFGFPGPRFDLPYAIKRMVAPYERRANEARMAAEEIEHLREFIGLLARSRHP